jgi:7,8-dihydro-6-hydroxymethylpterin-pyrophosphokinase
VIDLPGLVVPHPRLRERRFVLVPLARLLPGLVVPGTGRTVESLLGEAPPARVELLAP